MTSETIQFGLGFESFTSRRTVESYKAPLIPAWAAALIEEVCADQGRTDRPRVEWKPLTHRGWTRQEAQPTIWGDASPATYTPTRAQSLGSSGVTWTGQGRILVRAGSALDDQRGVLLHELAHWLSPLWEQHGRVFWEKAWELYEKFAADDLPRIRDRERHYKAMSEVVYKNREYRRDHPTLWGD